MTANTSPRHSKCTDFTQKYRRNSKSLYTIIQSFTANQANRNEMNENKHNPFTRLAAPTEAPTTRKYKPVCRICGMNHWPLDPSCLGKKSVKARIKAKLKALKRAKAQKKAIVQTETNSSAEVEKTQQPREQAKENIESFAEKITKLKSQTQQKTQPNSN